MTARIQSLGEQMAERREKELGMSQSRAARAAGVSRTTWINWETGAAIPESYNHVKIERVLRWEQGSVAAAIEYGRPAIVLADEPEEPESPRVSAIAQLLDELPEEEALRVLGVLTARVIRRRRQAAVRDLSRVDSEKTHSE